MEINLDNNNYLPGNEVSGSLILEVDKATNIRSLNLHVEGKENTSMSVLENRLSHITTRIRLSTSCSPL